MDVRDVNNKLSSPLTVTARKWGKGWELEIVPDLHYTQVSHLSGAEQQVRDYLDTVWSEDEAEHATWVINIIPDLDSISRELAGAREKANAAEIAQMEAAQAVRRAVLALKADGVSQSDIAFLMGVSRARVSQLVKTA